MPIRRGARNPCRIWDEQAFRRFRKKTMSHRDDDDGLAPRPLRDKRGLVNRVRRLRGHVDAIERALAGEASCSDLLQRITAARGAINGLMAEVWRSMYGYLSPLDSEPGATQTDAAEELICWEVDQP
jgi:FrmR/RcnR family transcriptional regulator, repressor of frmRAB operon